MFTCGRLVDQATQENDLPAPGACLAESVQLCRKDTANITRIITKTMDKLQKPSVQIRLKALRYLLHLAQNGPPAFSNEMKLYSTQISQCMGWRGAPHPTKGWEPYSEMKDVAQSLLDHVFAAPTTTAPTASFQQMQQATGGSVNRSAGISYMDSCGSGPTFQQRASLEPRLLGGQQSVGDKMIGFVKNIIPGIGKDKQPQQSTYGSYSNSGGYTPGVTTAPQYRPPVATTQQSAHQQMTPQYSMNAPPARGQFDQLQRDVSWKKPSFDAPVQKQKDSADTPAAKLMKISGNRANATNGELTQFRNTLSADSIEELIEGLKATDWKVRVRAISGLDICGEKFGYGAVSQTKDDVEKLTKAPQASLKNVAGKFYEKIKDVEPTGIPEEPSAFDFVDERDAAAQTGHEEVINFTAAEDKAPVEEDNEEVQETPEEEGEEEGEEKNEENQDVQQE
jgi:hypothetical protein